MSEATLKKSRTSRLRQVVDLFICFLFLAIVILPTMDKFLGLDTAKPRAENRALASSPAQPVNIEDIIGYPSIFEEWFKDHFGFRNRLLKTYNRLNRSLFGIINQVKAVKNGEGWFFYTGEDIANYHRGRPPFTEDDLTLWRDTLLERKNHVEANGGRYLVVIAPNKSTVYTEKLLDWMKTDKDTITRADQLIEFLRKNDGPEIIDLRRPVIEASKNELVFFKTDTHWNDLGAFAGASSIVEYLTRYFPKTKPLDRSDFTLTNISRAGGDLAMMYGVKEQTTEIVPRLTPETAYTYVVTDEQAYTDVEGYADDVFTSSENAPIPKAVILRDSFTSAMVPFLSDYFGRGVYLPTFRYPKDIIEREKPDVVIRIFVERILQNPQF